MKRHLLAAASAVLLVVLGTLYLQQRSIEREAEATSGLQWRAGRSQAYDLRVDSSFEMTMPGARSGQSMAVRR